MAEFISLYSGSSGNSSVVRCGQRYLIVDMGKGVRTTSAALKALGLAVSDCDGILVTHVIPGKVAERLFAAADVLGFALVLADDLGDILEAREAVVTLHLEMLGHGVGHLRGDDGLHDLSLIHISEPTRRS